MTAQARSEPFYRALPIVIVAGCLISMLTFGPRSAMGFFQLPLLADKGWDPAYGARPLKPTRQQHAECLMRQPPLERIGDQMIAPTSRKRFDQDFARIRQG